MQDVAPVLERVALNGVPLVLLARGVEGEALSIIEVNNRNETTDVMVVRVPGIRGQSGSVFEDLAVYTGGSVISEKRGFKLENATESTLGWAKQVTVERESTLVVGGGGDQAALRAYVDRLCRIRTAQPNTSGSSSRNASRCSRREPALWRLVGQLSTIVAAARCVE